MDEQMEEPMEDSPAGGGAEVDQGIPQEEKKLKVSSILRPGSMVMMTITVEDYQEQYWPKLENAIQQLLTMTPGDYIPISYEQMYSCVYKCVCKQFSERLYQDLINQVSSHLERLSVELQSHDPSVYIERFNFALNQYLQALAGIVPIFNYMNRFYIETRLKTDLNVELQKLFVNFVADKHVPRLIPLLVEANANPFSVSPPTMANLIKNLFKLKPEFAELRPQLFAKYIPNVLPPCREEDLERYIQETQQMQRDLRTHPDFVSGDCSRKRAGEDDPPKNSSLSFLPKGS